MREHSLGLTGEFIQWHEDLCSIVKAFFGEDSDEFSNISSIKLEPPPELLDAGESLLRDINENKEVGNTERLMQNVYREYFRKRCFDLEEVIAACIVEVRKKKDR